MRILMIRWKSIVEPDVIAAFKEKGHDLIVWSHTIEDPDYDREALKKLPGDLLSGTYDFVFSIDYFPIVARICNAVKIRYVSWSVDCPVIQYYSKTLSLPYNRVFLFDYAMYQEFVGENPEHIFYLPLGANVAHNDQVIKTITREDRHKFSADVSFVGSTYEEKCKYNEIVHKLSPYTKGFANGLMDAQLLVYGGFILKDAMTPEFLKRFVAEIDWGGINEDYRRDDSAFVSQFYLGEKVSEQERLRLLRRLSEQFQVKMFTMSDTGSMPKIQNCGPADSRTQMPKIFHLSKINLNITSKTIQTGLPQRFWDVLAAGGFLLSNLQAELPEFLVPGVDVETYSSFAECEQKIAYYLNHEEERKTIARNGYEKLKAQYTYGHRIDLMMGMLQGC